MTVVRFARVEDVAVDADLTATEVRRRDRLARPSDRAAYTAAHLLVRACAGDLLEVPADSVVLDQRCPSCGGDDHGRPSVRGCADVFVSLSHTLGHVAAMASFAPCGIDVQLRAGSIPRRALTPREAAWVGIQPDPVAAFTRLWVRKEALVKLGVATLADLGGLDVLGGDSGFAFEDWQAGDLFGALTEKGSPSC